MIYQIHDLQMATLRPFSIQARMVRKLYSSSYNPWSYGPIGRYIRGSMELIERQTDVYEKPEFGFTEVLVGGEMVEVKVENVCSKPFCDLLHFRRSVKRDDPKVLLVAPMAGHYATLLRKTAAYFLAEHEVYITDWKNARDVPKSQGDFGFDDYVDYIAAFIRKLGPNTHVVAVCQPCVPVIVAATLLAAENDPAQPASMTLMGGPVDVRVQANNVSEYAARHNVQFFKKRAVHRVPHGYRGCGREVYPGFIQLSAFLAMNPASHLFKNFTFFGSLLRGDSENAEAHRQFYNEYLAVMDLPAKFYLETVKKVFMDYDLPRGQMHHRGRLIDPTAVKQTALLTVEGELDDITSPGQTRVAHEILSSIPDEMRGHHLQEQAGHYGIFSGTRFRECVGPQIAKFIQTHDARRSETLN
jgi:poly(3-hydroxybutyrate) depolymerase